MYFLTGSGSFFLLIITSDNNKARLNTGASHPPKSPIGEEPMRLAITLKRSIRSMK